MPRESLMIGIIGRSYPPASIWAERTLRPFAVLTAPAGLAAGAVMSDIDGVQTVYLGDHRLTLYHTETAHYRTNLMAAQPSVWVSMDAGKVQMVSPDPYEGESLASDPARLVEALAMPGALRARIADFIARHHVEEKFHKRKRTPAAPEADPRAPRILPPDQTWIKR